MDGTVTGSVRPRTMRNSPEPPRPVRRRMVILQTTRSVVLPERRHPEPT